MVGWVVHSALLVPFWSWQYSHGKHHKYTNHLVLGETHVPNLEGDPVIGDAFPLLRESPAIQPGAHFLHRS